MIYFIVSSFCVSCDRGTVPLALRACGAVRSVMTSPRDDVPGTSPVMTSPAPSTYEYDNADVADHHALFHKWILSASARIKAKVAEVNSPGHDPLSGIGDGSSELFDADHCKDKLTKFGKYGEVAVNGFWLESTCLASDHEPPTLSDLDTYGDSEYDVEKLIAQGTEESFTWLKAIPVRFMNADSTAETMGSWPRIGLDTSFFALFKKWDEWLGSWAKTGADPDGRYLRGHNIFYNTLRHVPCMLFLVPKDSNTHLNTFAKTLTYVESVKTASDKLGFTAWEIFSHFSHVKDKLCTDDAGEVLQWMQTKIEFADSSEYNVNKGKKDTCTKTCEVCLLSGEKCKNAGVVALLRTAKSALPHDNPLNQYSKLVKLCQSGGDSPE